MSDSAHSERPREPEFRAAQRARVVLDFEEAGEPVHCADEGWARVDGAWLHFYPDEFEQWQSWPMERVLMVEWGQPDE